MSLPSMFDVPFRHISISISDVADLITSIRDELKNQLPAGSRWTEPVAGTFQSPDCGDGNWISLTVARVSASRISYQLKDNTGLMITVDTGNIICQDILASPAVTTLHIFSSPYYLVVDSAGGTAGTPEVFACGILDRSPEPLVRPRASFWSSRGPRTNLGTLGSPSFMQCIILPVGATAYSSGGSNVHDRNPAGGGYYDRITVNGIAKFEPMEFANGDWFLGRAFNLLIGDGWQFPYGSIVTVPLDDVTTGTFFATGWTNQNANYNHIRIFARIS